MDCRTTLVSVRRSPSQVSAASGRLAGKPLTNRPARRARPLPPQLTFQECEFRTEEAPGRGIMGRVTAPPGAPNETSGDKVATPEEPSTAAFGLLSRAQDLADHVRSDVEAEVAAMRAEASAAHDEARRLLIDASNVHEDAISAQRSAQARLREAQDEAAQLVAGAADQATLVADAANLTTESLLASTQAEADKVRAAAMAEDLRVRGLATTELEQTREKYATLLSEAAAEIESRQIQASAELRQLGQKATEHATSIRASVEDFSRMAISKADAEASATHAITMQELEQARAETAVLRSTAARPRSHPPAMRQLPRPIACWMRPPTTCTGPKTPSHRCCRPPKPRPTGCVMQTTRQTPSIWPPAVGSCRTSFPASRYEYAPQ